MKRVKLFQTATVVAGLLLGLTSCNSGGSGPFANYDVFDVNTMPATLDAYSQKDLDCTEDTSSNALKVYIDFSDGMVNAYKGNDNNRDMITAFANKFTTQAEFYKMAAGEITPMDFSYNEIFNKVTDPRSYSTEIMAPIEKTLQTVTEGNAEALIVTDFEEYTTDKKLQKRAYADKYFTEWVKKGNIITFYVTDFTENRIAKHLYFAVFSTPKGTLDNMVKEALQGRSLDYKVFSLTTNVYSMSTKYPAASKGGEYLDNENTSVIMAVDEAHYINKCDKGYEYYPCGLAWKEMVSNAKAMMEPGVPKPFSHLFRNLFMDLSNKDSYNIESLTVKVSDITDDYVFFAQCNEAKKHTPKMTKDASGNMIFAEDNDEIAVSCYDQTGKLRSEWIYAPKEAISIADALLIDDELFNNTKESTPDKVEIGVKLHSNFTGEQITNPNALVRIDVVIDKCAPNLDGLDEIFLWENNASLLESVRNALQECNPQGKVVYSYFVRCL